MNTPTITNHFVLYKLKSRLNYLESRNPLLYEVFNAESRLICSFSHPKWVRKYEAEGHSVCRADLKEEMEGLRLSIAEYEKR